MISPERINKAKHEGYNAYMATNGNPYLTKNEYTRFTAQWRAFNEGWNEARRELKRQQQFPFLRKVA